MIRFTPCTSHRISGNLPYSQAKVALRAAKRTRPLISEKLQRITPEMLERAIRRGKKSSLKGFISETPDGLCLNLRKRGPKPFGSDELSVFHHQKYSCPIVCFTNYLPGTPMRTLAQSAGESSIGILRLSELKDRSAAEFARVFGGHSLHFLSHTWKNFFAKIDRAIKRHAPEIDLGRVNQNQLFIPHLLSRVMGDLLAEGFSYHDLGSLSSGKSAPCSAWHEMRDSKRGSYVCHSDSALDEV